MTRLPIAIIATSVVALFCYEPHVAAQPAVDSSPDLPIACEDEACVVRAAQTLLHADRYEDAADYLAAELDAYPESGSIQILLGAAYLEMGDHLWAADTFARRLDQAPDDCEARFWLAWVDVLDQALREAKHLLEGEECSASGPLRTRAMMLSTLIAFYEDDRDTAEREIESVRGQEAAYSADRGALATLTRMIWPNRLDELNWNLFVEGGYTTNALLGSPADPSLEGTEPSSALIRTNGWIRWVPEFGSLFRPSLEGQVIVLGYLASEARDFSYLNLTGRVGFFLDWGLPRLYVGYRPDYMLLAGGDEFDASTTWFYSAHRGELEAELVPWLMAFVGAGRRDFRELGRSRNEVDGGVGGQARLVQGLTLLWALAGRGHSAQNPAYSLGGVTGLVSLIYQLPGGWSARASATLAGDWYPDSAGFFADETRQDTFYKVGGQVWSPFFAGVGFGVVYDYSDRDSTAPEYSFSDHRVTFRVNWRGALDLGLPSRSEGTPTAEVDWGLEGQGEGPGERIQDLLRQDEQIQQNCGCAE